METDGRSGGTGCSVKITIQMEAYMLVTAKEMLEKARDGKYAVGHFNINNLEWTKAILQTAEELRSPVILGVSEGAGKYMTGFKTVVDHSSGSSSLRPWYLRGMLKVHRCWILLHHVRRFSLPDRRER